MLVLVFSAKLRGIENICTYLYKFTSCKTCTISFWVNISTFLETKYEQQAKPELAPCKQVFHHDIFGKKIFMFFQWVTDRNPVLPKMPEFRVLVMPYWQIQVDVIEAFSSFFGIFRKLLEELPKNPISR